MKTFKLKRTGAFLAALAVFLLLGLQAQAADSDRISVAELNKLLDSKAPVVLIDVRTPEEFAAGHIPGAVSMPLDTLGGVSKLPGGGKVILYCKSGRRSQEAFRILSAKGFKGLVDLEGGILAWQESQKKAH